MEGLLCTFLPIIQKYSFRVGVLFCQNKLQFVQRSLGIEAQPRTKQGTHAARSHA